MATEADAVHPPMILTAIKKPPADSTSYATIQSGLTDSAKPIQLQRRRVWRACESCRRKKIKCDGHEPTCGQCVAAKLQCQWSQTKDRAALSRHYVQELEQRLMHYETLLSRGGQPPIEGGLPPASGSSGSLPNSATQTKVASPAASGSSVSPVLNDALPPEGDTVTEKFGQLALDEHGHGRWLGTSSTYSFVSNFQTMANSTNPERYSPNSPSEDNFTVTSMNSLYFPGAQKLGKSHSIPSIDEVLLPSAEAADELIDAYFGRYHFLMPILDKTSFLAGYRVLADNAESRSDPAFLSVVFAVFACASRLDQRLVETCQSMGGVAGSDHYEKALLLNYIGYGQNQIANVQCLALLASFLCSINDLPQAWLLVGQALRTGQDLGLHRSPRHLGISPVEKETRRKVWWNIYCLDRMLAVALGRPLGIDDVDCDVELPMDLDDEELPIFFSGPQITRAAPSLMNGFVALCKLYMIAGRLLRQVYALRFCKENLEDSVMQELQSSVDNLDHQLDEWCEELPACFKSQPMNEQQVSMGAVLCSSWYAVRITLHRNFLPVKQPYRQTGSTSVGKAISAARSCIFLASSIKSVIPPSHHLAFFIQYLFSSAVIILICAIHATDENASELALKEAQNCVNSLSELEGIWPGAKKCRTLLTELASVTKETMQNQLSRRSPAPMLAIHPPMVYPQQTSPPRGSNFIHSPTTGNFAEPSRPSHRTMKSKHRAHSKRRSMSQKRIKEEGDSPRDHGSDERTKHVRRNSLAGRSASVPRRSGIASASTVPNHHSPVFVESSSTEPVPHPIATLSNQPLYEMPLSATYSNESPYLQETSPGSWNYENKEWQVTSPVDPSSSGKEDFNIPRYSSSAGQYNNFEQSEAMDTLSYPLLENYSGPTPFDTVQGLPFAGLEYLQNYDGNGSDPISLELWNNNLGTNAFDLGPDFSFSSLMDLSPNMNFNHHDPVHQDDIVRA